MSCFWSQKRATKKGKNEKKNILFHRAKNVANNWIEETEKINTTLHIFELRRFFLFPALAIAFQMSGHCPNFMSYFSKVEFMKELKYDSIAYILWKRV